MRRHAPADHVRGLDRDGDLTVCHDRGIGRC